MQKDLKNFIVTIGLILATAAGSSAAYAQVKTRDTQLSESTLVTNEGSTEPDGSGQFAEEEPTVERAVVKIATTTHDEAVSKKTQATAVTQRTLVKPAEPISSAPTVAEQQATLAELRAKAAQLAQQVNTTQQKTQTAQTAPKKVVKKIIVTTKKSRRSRAS